MRMLVLCMFLLMGCANSQNYENQLQNWVGVSQETLYESWGTPNSEFYIAPGEKQVTYVKIDESAIDDETDPYQGEIEYSAIETPDYGFADDQNQTYYCKTSFTIINGEVTDYTFNGDDCVAN